MYKFTKIILEDCFAFEHQEFEFKSGIHSVCGLNGASKTSIYLALAQGLFNKNPKGVKIDDVSNTITKRPYQITIYFTKGSDEYKVVNSRKKGTISVEVNGKSISRKTIPQNLELIREILGDTYETFVGGTYQASDSTLDLLDESGDTARKNFINKILKAAELDAMLATTKEKIKQLKALLKDRTSQVAYLATQKLTLKEAGEFINTKPLEDGVETLEEAKDAAALLAAKTKAERDAQGARIEAYQKYKSNVELLDNLTYTLNELKEPPISKAEVLDELEARTKELASVETAYRTAKSKLKELKEPELECSRCGHKLNAEQALELYNSDKTKFEFDMDNATQMGSFLTAELNIFKGYLATWESIETTTQRINLLRSTLVEVDMADAATYASASTAYDKAEAEYARASKAHAEALQKLNAAIRNNDLVTLVAKFNQEAEAKNDAIDLRAKGIMEEIKDIEKRLDLLDNWARVLGPNGYRVHSMVRFLAVLNQTMDKYANIISGGKIKCNFFVTSEGKVDFSVVDPDKQVPFPNWSKGEQARVKLACLFAVIELLEVMGSGSYNVLVLDEIFSALDDEGKEGLFDVLSYLRAKGKCIYTISHTPLVNPVVFDSTIEVVKTNGLAKIL